MLTILILLSGLQNKSWCYVISTTLNHSALSRPIYCNIAISNLTPLSSVVRVCELGWEVGVQDITTLPWDYREGVLCWAIHCLIKREVKDSLVKYFALVHHNSYLKNWPEEDLFGYLNLDKRSMYGMAWKFHVCYLVALVLTVHTDGHNQLEHWFMSCDLCGEYIVQGRAWCRIQTKQGW